MNSTEFEKRLNRLKYSGIPFRNNPNINAMYLHLLQIKENPTKENLKEAEKIIVFIEMVISKMYQNEILFNSHQTLINGIMQLERTIIEDLQARKKTSEIKINYIEKMKKIIPKQQEEQIKYYAEWLMLEQYGKIKDANETIDKLLLQNSIAYKLERRKIEKLRQQCIEYYQETLIQKNKVYQK